MTHRGLRRSPRRTAWRARTAPTPSGPTLGVDVIYVATTHAQHYEHALLALQAGKPVLVEKAFTLNAREAREVVALARSRRLFCMEAMWLRLHPLIRAAHDLAASGRIGEVVGVRADLSRRFEFDPAGRLFDLSAGGGALLDLGVYPATFAWLILGRPTSVATTGSLSPTGSGCHRCRDAVGLCRRPGRPDLLQRGRWQPLRGTDQRHGRPADPGRVADPPSDGAHGAHGGRRGDRHCRRGPGQRLRPGDRRGRALPGRGRAGEPVDPALSTRSASSRPWTRPVASSASVTPTTRAEDAAMHSPTEASRSSSSAVARSRFRWRGWATGCRRSSTSTPAVRGRGGPPRDLAGPC